MEVVFQYFKINQYNSATQQTKKNKQRYAQKMQAKHWALFNIY